MTIVLDFSWDGYNTHITQQKLETMVMHKFGGLTRCIMVYVKMVKRMFIREIYRPVKDNRRFVSNLGEITLSHMRSSGSV